ncbi:hypothetical protein [Notoacmeibacter ruber]|nr:hypothetical protein [Notoacmeibacter ruber]
MNVEGPTSRTQDWAAIAMVYPAMFRRQALKIEGAISETLLRYLRDDIQTVLKAYDPRLARVPVNVEETHRNREITSRTATGFSAGVDSFFTLGTHPEITDLTVFNVGAMGKGRPKIFERYLRRTHDYAARKGLGAITVDSNLDKIFSAATCKKVNFQKTHSLRNAAAAMASGISNYLYSSGVDYNAVAIQPHRDTAYLDAVLLPLLSTESLRIHSAGSSYTRVEKTLFVSELQDACEMLDVCAGNPTTRFGLSKPNCSKCWKCVETLLTLEAADRLELFEPVFDIDFYKSNRDELLLDLLIGKHRHDRAAIETFDFARKRGVHLPNNIQVTLWRLRRHLRRKAATG